MRPFLVICILLMMLYFLVHEDSDLKNVVLEFKKLRDNKKSLNYENLKREYNLDSICPLQVINNVVTPKLLELISKYYKKRISDNVWKLGDEQSNNRYVYHNEPLSRILHYEILPLIEKIVGKKLKPTNTYFSGYTKGSDLPPHIDRKECEYTVSFLVDKPENSNWNLYIHKKKQTIRHSGIYDIAPKIEDCYSVDCEKGGLIMFQGIDHIHFREKLEHDYYNILLFHYQIETRN